MDIRALAPSQVEFRPDESRAPRGKPAHSRLDMAAVFRHHTPAEPSPPIKLPEGVENPFLVTTLRPPTKRPQSTRSRTASRSSDMLTNQRPATARPHLPAHNMEWQDHAGRPRSSYQRAVDKPRQTAMVYQGVRGTRNDNGTPRRPQSATAPNDRIDPTEYDAQDSRLEAEDEEGTSDHSRYACIMMC